MDNWLFLEQLVSTYVCVVIIWKSFYNPIRVKVGIVTAVGPMNEELWFCLLARARDFTLLQRIQTSSGLTQPHIQ